jgi:hypothetical protein
MRLRYDYKFVSLLFIAGKWRLEPWQDTESTDLRFPKRPS